MSLEDAGLMLGISPERVRQLVVAGDLPGVRFGNAWAVPRARLLARSNQKNRRGRPLGVRRAWESIIANAVDLDDLGRFRNRGVVNRYEASRADVEQLYRQEGVIVSGVSAAIGYGELLSDAAQEAALYVRSSVQDQLGGQVVLVQDPLGSLVVRVVADAAWELASQASKSFDDGRLYAHRAAVALDLMDSPEPRHWIAAQNLIAEHV